MMMSWFRLKRGLHQIIEDLNLYYFSNAKPQYYESITKKPLGKFESIYIDLLANIIPMLLGNFVTMVGIILLT